MTPYRRRATGRCASLLTGVGMVVLVVCAAARESRAAAYEGFDYPVGPSKNPGIGIIGSSWRGGSGFVDGTSAFTPSGWDDWFVTSVPGSLSDPTGTLATTGNHVETTDRLGGSVGRRLQQTLGTPGTDVWLSWLQRSGDARSGFDGLIIAQPDSDTSAHGLYFIGEPGSGPGEGTYVIGTSGVDDTVVSSGVPVVPNQTAFLVVHLQFQEGNDLATLYVNPTPGAAAPAGGVTYSGLDMPVLNPFLELDRFSAGPAAVTAAFDELRVGDSYAAVAPVVPEPGVAAAAGAALLLLATRSGDSGRRGGRRRLGGGG